jgi:hypothetical protein
MPKFTIMTIEEAKRAIAESKLKARVNWAAYSSRVTSGAESKLKARANGKRCMI